MALRLSEDTVDAQDVLENVIEEDERHVDFLFTEGAEAGFDEVAEMLSLHRHVVL
jgi:hypothetical protein